MTIKNVEALENAMITYAKACDFDEMKSLSKECILLDHKNAFALYCHALARINAENWSDVSIFLMSKYIKETYQSFMTGRGNDKSKLANLVDETLSVNVLDHIQDCQYSFENKLTPLDKKEKYNEFCAHVAALIDCLLVCSQITLTNATNGKTVENGLNMLDSCVACIDEVGDYLDNWVNTKTYSQTKKAEIISIIRSLRLKQTIIYDKGQNYLNLYDLIC